MVLTSDNPRMGDAREEIGIRYSGSPMKIAFNAHYFQEVLRVLEGVTVRIGVTDPLAPCLVKDGDDPDFLSVVMPMRID
jgi:DNA polymerase-3 subunit beta